MLETEARKTAAAIEERVGASRDNEPSVTVTVGSDRSQPDGTAPGAGRPTFTRYHIEISDGDRVATVGLDQAADLLDELEPGCGADRLFAAIHTVRTDDAR